MRCLTVTCNAAVDTTYVLDRLEPGGINRVERALPAPGGKGNNVARVLATLGHTVVATGFAGGHTGRFIEDGLRARGVEPAFVPVAGASRVCLTMVERETGRITEIREPGAAVTETDAARLLDLVRRLAGEVDVVVVSGSLAPGLPADFSASLLGAARRDGVSVAFDAGGETLRLGLAGGPDLIAPNREELAELIGPVGRRANDDELIAAVRSRVIGSMLGASADVLLTVGGDGAALIRRDRVYRAVAPAVDVVNTVGCGDALLAGFLDARSRTGDDREALGHAVAVGTAAALQAEVGMVNVGDIARLRALVRVSEGLGRAA